MQKVQVRNNWENLTFFIGDKELKPGTIYENTLLEWQDGTRTYEKLIWRKQRVIVPDMGSSYELTRNECGIELDVHGIKKWFDLILFKYALLFEDQDKAKMPWQL